MVPRRICLDQYSTGEKAIQQAVDAVERMGASVHLTDAVILLSKAREKVADHVDDMPLHEHEWEQDPTIRYGQVCVRGCGTSRTHPDLARWLA